MFFANTMAAKQGNSMNIPILRNTKVGFISFENIESSCKWRLVLARCSLSES